MRAGRREEARTELEVFAQQQAEAEAAGQREFQLDAIRRQASKDALAGDRQGALARFEDAARIDPQSARSHRDLGLALLRAQRPREAVEYLVAAQRIEETAEGFVYLVDAYGAVGNAEEANRQRALARAFALSKKMERVRELEGADDDHGGQRSSSTEAPEIAEASTQRPQSPQGNSCHFLHR